MENTAEKIRSTRKKTKKPKVENYYKILGIRANASSDVIKQSYIKLVKQFPPEQHPEQFEQIRRAYETLRNPQKRAEYDLMRKFGGSVEKLMDEAIDWMEQERWDKAEKVFIQVLAIAPDTTGARIGLAQTLLFQDRMDEFEQETKLLVKAASSPEEEVTAFVFIAKALFRMDFTEKALEVLELIQRQYPLHASSYTYLVVQVYQELGRGEEAWRLIESGIPAIEDQHPEHISLFIEWINALIELEKWQLWSKVQQRVKHFLKSITDSDDKMMTVEALLYESRSYLEVRRFREAAMFVDLASYLDYKNAAVQALRRDVQELQKVEREIERTSLDDSIFPLVSILAARWFYMEINGGVAPDWEEMIPQGYLQEMEQMNQFYVSSIRRLQKKYPVIYKRYQPQWDELLAEKTVGMNREERRRLM